MTMTRLMTDEVQDAMDRGVPLVALETTLVSHGFPGGEGVQVALAAEARVREAGAVPATIGLVDGTLRVGLTDVRPETVRQRRRRARKVGARDLAACLEQGALGATTVGGTLAVCRLAGIRFMATGGTGGVHRGFAPSPTSRPTCRRSPGPRPWWCRPASNPSWTWRPPRNCWRPSPSRCWAGAPRTLPMFYSADGGPPVSAVVTDAAEAARVTATHWLLNGTSGVLLTRPPDPSLDIEPILAEAVDRVREQGIRGPAVTPAVLDLVHELSGGRSIEVNRQLIADNAGLAAEVAVAYAGQD